MLTKKKTLEILLDDFKNRRAGYTKIVRLRDQELQTEMKVLDIFLVDLKMIKYEIGEKEYNAACKQHDLESLA